MACVRCAPRKRRRRAAPRAAWCGRWWRWRCWRAAARWRTPSCMAAMTRGALLAVAVAPMATALAPAPRWPGYVPVRVGPLPTRCAARFRVRMPPKETRPPVARGGLRRRRRRRHRHRPRRHRHRHRPRRHRHRHRRRRPGRVDTPAPARVGPNVCVAVAATARGIAGARGAAGAAPAPGTTPDGCGWCACPRRGNPRSSGSSRRVVG